MPAPGKQPSLDLPGAPKMLASESEEKKTDSIDKEFDKDFKPPPPPMDLPGAPKMWARESEEKKKDSIDKEFDKNFKQVQLIDGKTYYLHRIGYGNSLYSLSKMYSVKIKDLTRENPQLKEGLKKTMIGQVIRIPVKKVDTKAVRIMPGTTDATAGKDMLEDISIQMTELSFPSGTNGKESGTFLWKAKPNKPNKPNKRRSLVRQASAHVRHVITTKQTQIPCSTCYRTIETEMYDMTNISFGYLVLAEWVTTIAVIVAYVSSGSVVLFAALVTWFFLQSALTFAALDGEEPDEMDSFMSHATLFLCPQGLVIACVLGGGLGEGLYGCAIFLWMFGSLVFGVPLRLLGYPAGTTFMEGAMRTGQAFTLGCFKGCFAMATAAAGVFSFFAGTVYLLTTPYTTVGLVITFVVLPLVVWPVAYIVVGVNVGLPVCPPCRRCGGSLFLCVLGIALFNLILPASLILFYL
jgi:LysM repeat protein